MPKRLLSFLLAVLLLLSLLGGCTRAPGDTDTDQPSNDPNTPTLNGVALTEYVIVYDVTVKRSADHLAEQLTANLGITLTMVAESAYTGTGNAIFVGGFGYNSYGDRRYAIAASQTDAGQALYLYGDSSTTAMAAVKCFVSEYLKKTMTVTETDQRYLWKDSDFANGLTLRTENAISPCEGLTYKTCRYIRADGKGVNAYIAVISPALVPYIKSAAPTPGAVATVPTQAKAANALFAVNAGFFDIHGTNLPNGVCIVNGEVQNAPTGAAHKNFWFGITDEGKAVISDANGYNTLYKDKLPSAVGGSTMIIKNGKLTGATETLNPLTTVGVCKDGSVVIVCVDGRSTVSIGATYADIAQIYMDLDMEVRNVLNLDGGGSTTVVLRENSTYTVKNSPSDGQPRSVQSVLLLCPPN